MLLDNFGPNALAVIDAKCRRLFEDDTEKRFLEYFDSKHPRITIAGLTLKASEVLRECNQIAFLSLWDDWLMSPDCKDYYLIKFNRDDFRIYDRDEIDEMIEDYADYRDSDSKYDQEREERD